MQTSLPVNRTKTAKSPGGMHKFKLSVIKTNKERQKKFRGADLLYKWKERGERGFRYSFDFLVKLSDNLHTTFTFISIVSVVSYASLGKSLKVYTSIEK